MTVKRRTTYIQRPDAPFDQEQVVVTSSAVTIRDLDAAREDRLTFGLDDLSEELRTVIQHSNEFSLRWASEHSFEPVAPFPSRISPGLHVHYVPSVPNQPSDALGSLLCAAFEGIGTSQDGNCTTSEETFIQSPSRVNQFGAPFLQYHTQQPSLKRFVEYVRENICNEAQTKSDGCLPFVDSLLTADTVDVEYVSALDTLVLSGLWTTTPEGGWSEDLQKSSADRVEFGLLGAEQGTNADEIKMGGLLAVVGQDRKLKPTMFSLPSRHHTLPKSAKYAVSFSEPTGLHPTLSITIPRSALDQPAAPADTTCSLYTYLTLPSSVFGDQYQLGTSDPLFLESHNLAGLRAHSGETDLEAPDWAVKRWGSTWLFELAAPTDNDDVISRSSNWTATIPLHLRYLSPSETGYRSAEVSWPVVFWACSAEYDDTPMGLNPFDRKNLGYDNLFSPRTFFYQFHPNGEHIVEKVEVPVLNLKDGEGLFQTRNIELATSAVISLGFLWILWRLFRVAWSSGISATSTAQSKDTHDKKD